jgi:hypothetical protein
MSIQIPGPSELRESVSWCGAEYRRPASLRRARGEGRALAVHPVQERGPSPRRKQRGERCGHYSARRSMIWGEWQVPFDRMPG